MNDKPNSALLRIKTWLVCKGRRQCLIKGLLVVLTAIVLTPVSREWALFAISGGELVTPKGWPFGEGRWRDWDKPTDPRELAAYEYAHNLKLPDSLPKPVPFNFSRYLLSNRQTTAAAYFDHLCKTEAGEFIFRKVDKVEGLYQMRAMPRRSDKVLRDRYWFEDPADWSMAESDGSPTLFIGGPGRGYRYFESYRNPAEIAIPTYRKHWMTSAWVGPGSATHWHYYHFDYTHGKGYTSGEVMPVSQIKSRYAYTWRGIRRERDREFGIAGGELVVLDQFAGKILGVRRGFAIAHQYNTHLDWEFANSCPDTLRADGKERLTKFYASYPFSFVFQILKPIDIDPSKMRFN